MLLGTEPMALKNPPGFTGSLHECHWRRHVPGVAPPGPLDRVELPGEGDGPYSPINTMPAMAAG